MTRDPVYIPKVYTHQGKDSKINFVVYKTYSGHKQKYIVENGLWERDHLIL